MSPVVSKLKGKTLHSQSREIISNVYDYMKEETKQRDRYTPEFFKQVQKVQERVATATGVSHSSVSRILRDRKTHEAAGTSFDTPGKKHNVPKRITEVDDFNKCVIRRAIHNFYVTEKAAPTIKRLMEKLKEDIQFQGSATSLRRIIRSLGFKWKKTRTNRSVLIERHDIRSQREKYLTCIRKYKAEGRPIVYQDETYIHSSHTVPKGWTDDSNSGLMAPIAKGERLIIVHAGGKQGFIPNALLMYRSQKRTGDFHNEMNAENYTKWLRTMLIPNLPPNAVLITDNASYHNIQVDKPPSSNSLKNDMKVWLATHNIPFDENSTKIQLYDLIKVNKPAHKTFLINQILAESNHTALRLSVYHPDLNPIGLIWGDVKQWVASRNVTFKIKDVEDLCRQRFAQIGQTEWENVCQSVEENEQHYYDKDGIVEERIESIIIQDNGMESSGEDSEHEGETIDMSGDENMSGVEEMEDD